MSVRRTDDLRITQVRPLIPPAILLEEIPISERASNVVSNTRQAIADALDGREARALSSLDYLHVTDNTLALFPELAPHVVGGKDSRDKYAVNRSALQRSDAWRRPLRVGTIVKLSRCLLYTSPSPRDS